MAQLTWMDIGLWLWRGSLTFVAAVVVGWVLRLKRRVARLEEHQICPKCGRDLDAMAEGECEKTPAPDDW